MLISEVGQCKCNFNLAQWKRGGLSSGCVSLQREDNVTCCKTWERERELSRPAASGQAFQVPEKRFEEINMLALAPIQAED